MIKRTIFMGLLVICTTTAWSVENSAYPLMKPLILPSGQEKDIIAFEVDEEVFATGIKLDSMRIYRDGEIEVPRVVRIKKLIKSVEVVRNYPTKVKRLKMLDNNEMEILVTCPTNAPSDSAFVALELQTNLRNFEKQVDVYGANADGAWVLISLESTLFDYTRYMDLRNTKVKLKPNRYKQYRVIVRQRDENTPSPLMNLSRETRGGVTISEVEQREFRTRPFRVNRIMVSGAQQRQKMSKEIMRSYSVVSSTNYIDKAKPGKSYFEFTVLNTPLSEVEVITADRNFSRSVCLEALDESVKPARYLRLQNARLENISLGGYSRRSMKIKLTSAQRGYRYKTYRLVVENRDAPALKISGVKVSGLVYEALYLPQSGKNDVLFYGTDDVAVPKYDLQQVLTSAPRDAIGAGTLGEQEQNPYYAPRKALFLWKNPRLLFTLAIVLALGILLFGIAKALRHVDAIE